MAYYKSPDEMFAHRVEVSIKLYEKYLNKGNMEKALEQEETIRHNFMQINKYTDKWKARVKLDEKENYSETEKSKNYEKFKQEFMKYEKT